MISRWHWLVAVVVSLLVHSAFLVGVDWQREHRAAKGPGIGGLEISLGPAGSYSQQEMAAKSPVKENPEIAPLAESLPALKDAMVVEKVTLKKPEQVPDQELKPIKKAAHQKAALPFPSKQDLPTKIENKPTPELAVKEEHEGDSSQQLEERYGRGTKVASGDGDGSAGGGIPGLTPDYIALLQAWLEKHKKYPRKAQRRRQQGTTELYIKMNRMGNVLDYYVVTSSGFKSLDQEVEKMIQRAQPLPPLPKEINKGLLEIIVPVQFYLR